MLITDDEAKELKTWVIKKLEDISDADSDVLADYVLALIREDTPHPELRANAIANLDDFLKDNTAGFVDEVFSAIATRSYDPSYVPPPAPTLPAQASVFTPPVGPSSGYSPGNARGGYNNGSLNQSRKRSFNDSQDVRGGQDAHYSRGDRQMKQMRRSNANRGGNFMGGADRGFQPQNTIQNLPLPTNTGMMNVPNMPFDLNDPMAVFLSMQALGLPPPPLPGSPPGFPQPNQPNWSIPTPPMKNKIAARCKDYDIKGVCLRGDACPFDHGNNPLVIPSKQDEYDPKNSSMMDFQKTPDVINDHGHPDVQRGNFRGRSRGAGRGDRGGLGRKSNRAEFSHSGPQNDRTITSIVVEQIPEENFDEQSVRNFFSDFGTIEKITMQAYKHLAIVQYSDWSAAKRAYDSPKVIFDNRFVKVYWYKPDAMSTQPTNGTAPKSSFSESTPKPDEPLFDKEEFERNSQLAQKKLEEKKALMKEAEAKRQELEKQKEELLKKQGEEKKKLMEKLKAKGLPMGDGSSPVNGTHDSSTTPKTSSQTEVLRATLAALEAEAQSLGIDTNAIPDSNEYRGRGGYRGRSRGFYRGRGTFPESRGGYDLSRGGGFRGRGAIRGRGGGAYNLDNRPKKVKVSGVEFDAAKDESLRQFLLGVGEFEDITPSPTAPGLNDGLTVTFKDRFTAEKFMYGPKDLPSIGKVEMTWVNTPLPPVQLGASQTARRGSQDDDTEMAGSNAEGFGAGGGNTASKEAEMDYDVAEDDDRWGEIE